MKIIKEIADKHLTEAIKGSMGSPKDSFYNGFLKGYKEAMRWRDPVNEKPEASVDVLIKAERKTQSNGDEVKDIIYMASCVSKRDGKFIHEGYTKGRYGSDIYVKILGWRPLEVEG